jgi:hypothetical protein
MSPISAFKTFVDPPREYGSIPFWFWNDDLQESGQSLGVRMWAPYRFSLGKQPGGEHQLELRITNSMANAYEGVQSPSGLIGPVNLI